MENRTLKAIIVALLAAFLIYLYNYPPGLEEGIDEISENTICSDYSNSPKSELKVSLIHRLTNGYKWSQGRAINESLGFNDARSIWFDFETLKTFMYHLETETKKRDTTIASGDLGIRIYYGSYPDKDSWGSYPDLKVLEGEGYEELHTLVMIPTMRKDSLNFDFNPLDYETYSNGLGVILSYENAEVSNPQSTYGLTGVKEGSNLETEDEGDPPSIGAQNHGFLIPPGSSYGQGF